jgi:hypothetical protein
VDHINHSLVDVNEIITMEWQEKSLQNLLYSTGALRKHKAGEGEE